MPSIDRNRIKQSDLRQALDAHLRGLPADAPLRNVIARPEIEATLVEFDSADVLAIKKQRSYRRLGRVALWAMMIGAIIGALVLLPIDPMACGLAATGHRRLPGACPGSDVRRSCMDQLSDKSVLQWMQYRSEADEGFARRSFAPSCGRRRCEGVVATGACLFQRRPSRLATQLTLARRGIQHRKSAGLATPLQRCGLSDAWRLRSRLGVARLVSLAARYGIRPWWRRSARAAIQWLLPHEHAGAGNWVWARSRSSVLAFASARTFMDQDDRNAACYGLDAPKSCESLSGSRVCGPLRRPPAVAARPRRSWPSARPCREYLDAEHLAWSVCAPAGRVRDRSQAREL